jgi:hypothetical protein
MKFHMPGSNGSLVIAIKVNNKYGTQVAAMLLVCILQELP